MSDMTPRASLSPSLDAAVDPCIDLSPLPLTTKDTLLCSCGRVDAPCLYRWAVLSGQVYFQCSICDQKLGGNSTNSHLHMLNEHKVADACVVWLNVPGKSTHRKHRTVARDSNVKPKGKSRCSDACWERFLQAVIASYSVGPRRPTDVIFKEDTAAEQYCDVRMHKECRTAPPTGKTVQSNWAAIRKYLLVDHSTSAMKGKKGRYHDVCIRAEYNCNLSAVHCWMLSERLTHCCY